MNSYPLNNQEITNTQQQIFYAVFKEYIELKNLKEDSADRPYKLFSLAQIKSMDYNVQEFYYYLGTVTGDKEALEAYLDGLSGLGDIPTIPPFTNSSIE